MDAVILDIETVGSSECERFLEPVSAPANYKDEAKIAAYCAEARAKQIDRAGLEADLCEVVAIGFQQQISRRAFSATNTAVYTRGDMDERGLLETLWEMVAARGHLIPVVPLTIIGFNILSFDLPVLIRRSQLLGVPYPDLNLDRYRTPHIDLLERLSFHGKLTYRSLKFYCQRFGIPLSNPTSGKDIAALVAAQDWAGVASHCRADVDATALLAQRLGYLPTAQAEEMVL